MARGSCRIARWMGKLLLRDTAGCFQLIRGSLQTVPLYAGLAGCFVPSLGAVRAVLTLDSETALTQPCLLLSRVFGACKVTNSSLRKRGTAAERRDTGR